MPFTFPPVDPDVNARYYAGQSTEDDIEYWKTYTVAALVDPVVGLVPQINADINIPAGVKAALIDDCNAHAQYFALNLNFEVTFNVAYEVLYRALNTQAQYTP